MQNDKSISHVCANICFHYHWLPMHVLTLENWSDSLKKKMSQDQQRESWSNHCEFFLSSLGLAVGLGKVEIVNRFTLHQNYCP